MLQLHLKSKFTRIYRAAKYAFGKCIVIRWWFFCARPLSIFIACIGMYANHEYKEYTNFSIVMLLYALIDELASPQRTALLPILLVNICGLSSSFHSALVFDPTSFRKMAVLCNFDTLLRV